MPEKTASSWHGFTLKDLLSITISLGALLISGMAAYYTFFYQRTLVNALIDEPYPSYEFVPGVMTDIAYAPTLTVINDGNRPVAILGMVVVTRQWQDLPDEGNVCEGERGGVIARFFNGPSQETFAPAIVQPANVVILRPSFTAPMQPAAMVARVGETIPQDTSPDKHVSTCLRLELAAPDRGRVTTEIALSRQSLSMDGGAQRMEANPEASLIRLIH